MSLSKLGEILHYTLAFSLYYCIDEPSSINGLITYHIVKDCINCWSVMQGLTEYYPKGIENYFNKDSMSTESLTIRTKHQYRSSLRSNLIFVKSRSSNLIYYWDTCSIDLGGSYNLIEGQEIYIFHIHFAVGLCVFSRKKFQMVLKNAR